MAKGFKIDIKTSGLKELEKELKELPKNLQKFLDSFGKRYQGKSVAVIKPALKRELKNKLGLEMSGSELTECATAISEGESIEVK
jgi:hypothetical protein